MALDPLHQFQIQQIGSFNVAGQEIVLTNQSVWLVGATVGIMLLFAMGVRNMAMVPGRMQAFVELTFEFIQNLVKDTAGKEALKYMPFIMTLFLFLSAANLIGMVPGSYTAMSQVPATAFMAVSVFVSVVVIGLIRHKLKFFSLFLPHGTHWAIAPLIIVIEIISFFARPFTLAVRLAANMMAGHILLKVFATFVILVGGGLFTAASGLGSGVASIAAIAGGAVPLFLVFAITLLETFVAVLQAYVFTVLTCVYLNDSLHLH